MRKCIRCDAEMVENLAYAGNNFHFTSGWIIPKDSVIGKDLGVLSMAVCPECGYAEFYLEDLDTLKEFATK